jgi:hypothetical protein
LIAVIVEPYALGEGELTLPVVVYYYRHRGFDVDDEH